MSKEEFLVLINKVSNISLKFAEKYLKSKLISEFRYDVYLNSSHDDASLTQFDIYPEDNERIETGITAKEVSILIYRNGKVPVWIDISVNKSDLKTTTFKLICAGRYSNDVNEYYYKSRGTGPLGVKNHNLPSDYKEGQRFKLM